MSSASWPTSASTPATASAIIEVWNKIDLLDDGNRARLLDEGSAPQAEPPIAISAVTGEGIDALAAR